MAITAEKNSQPKILPPAGTHVARCYQMVHIGTVKETTGKYAGQLMNKVRLSWEIPDELHDFGKGPQPFSISQEYTLSMSPKANLRKMLEGWRGQGFTEKEAESFDVTKLLGVPCMVSIIHKKSQAGNDYAQITSVTTLPKGFVCPPAVNTLRKLEYDNFDRTFFDSLPDFLRKQIEGSKEYAAMMNPSHTEAADDEPIFSETSSEDLPF